MEKNALTNLTLKTGTSWGYGLYSSNILVVTDEDTVKSRLIGHGGDTWAFHADFKYIPELNIGAVVLTNTDKGARIASATRLIKLYLKETRESKIKTDPSARNTKNQDRLCKPEEILGMYNLGSFNITVTDPEKITFKQGPAKIILTPMNDSLMYKAKIRLFGLIPMKVKHQEFRFVHYDSSVYFKVIYTGSRKEDYVAIKMDKKPISDAWKGRFGSYELVGDFYSCKDCEYVNFEGVSMELKEDKGILVARMSAKSKDTRRELMLQEVTDSLCVTMGIGRNTGETVRFLENGNLYYSGFEFKKKN